LSPKLRQLSGSQVVDIFCAFGFKIHSQKGGHVKLRRMVAGGQKQTLTIPAHAELDVGTLKAIIRQATRYIPETELRPHFYSD